MQRFVSGGQVSGPIQKCIDHPVLFAAFLFVNAYFFFDYTFYDERFLMMNTKISEHALMPGIVLPRFDKEALRARFINEVKNTKLKKAMAKYIMDELDAFGIDSELHSWQKNITFGSYSGTSVSSVVRARRASGAEAIAVLVRMDDSFAVGSAMALAVHSREQTYWARDIFFVFLDDSMAGALAADAWLADYHGLNGRRLKERGGFLIAAIGYEYSPNLSSSEFEVLFNGNNGYLPNLDLVNAIIRVAAKPNVWLNPAIYGGNHKHTEDNLPLAAILSQAFTAADGIHSMFGSYGVQGVTIRVPRKLTGITREYLLEGVLRSLNNLHERFHQSYFLYVLTSPVKFVSVGYYMIFIAYFLVAIATATLKEWMSMKTAPILPSSLVILFLFGVATWSAVEYGIPLSGLDARSAIRTIAALHVFPVGLFFKIGSDSIRSFRFFLLLVTALFIGALSLLNFGLGFCAAIFFSPIVILMTRENRKKLSAVVRVLLSLIWNPLMAFIVLRAIHSKDLLLYGIPNDWMNVLMHELTESLPVTFNDSVHRLLMEYYVFGSFSLPLLCMMGAPIWNACLAMAQHVDEEEEQPVEKQKEE